MFWIINAILIAIAMAFILQALMKKEPDVDATREQNIAIAKEQLSDLEDRFEKNDVDEAAYKLIKSELEIALFDDLKQSEAELLPNPLEKHDRKKASKSIDTWLILLLVPIITIPVYLNLGSLNFTKEFDSKKAELEAPRSNMPLKADGTPDIEKVAQNLKLEMESNPTDPQGWYMLGRAYVMIERFSEAVESFDKSLALRPDSADTMLALANSLSRIQSGKLTGRPRELVNKALLIEPQNLTALWFSGMAASQEADFAEAILHWEKVLPLIDDEADEKIAIIGLIAEAKSRLASEMIKQVDGAVSNNKEKEALIENTKQKVIQETKQGTEQSTEQGISVNISLSDDFNDKVSPEDSVFIYAKAVNGPPMPLAAVRKQVKDFPIDVMLNDEMAMMPTLKLSSFNLVTIGARISKTGQAIAQDGDLFAEETDIKLGDKVTLKIDQVYTK